MKTSSVLAQVNKEPEGTALPRRVGQQGKILHGAKDAVRSYLYASKIFQERLQPDKKVLYHYCTAGTLDAIVRCNNLLAGSIGYMNDANEFIHGRNFLLEALKMSTEPSIKKLKSRLSEKLTDDLFWQSKLMSTFCFCSSFSKDSLSLWRAYGDDGSGYAIGFDRSQLVTDPDSTSQSKLSLEGTDFPVFYNTAEKKNTANGIIKAFGEWLTENMKNQVDSTYWDNHIAYSFEGLCVNYAPMFKHLAFSAEREFRNVIFVNEQDDFFRSKYLEVNPKKVVITKPVKGYMKPFVQLNSLGVSAVGPCNEDGYRLPISEIVIGPCLEPQKAIYGVNKMLVAAGYEHVKIKVSGVPYLP